MRQRFFEEKCVRKEETQAFRYLPEEDRKGAIIHPGKRLGYGTFFAFCPAELLGEE